MKMKKGLFKTNEYEHIREMAEDRVVRQVMEHINRHVWAQIESQLWSGVAHNIFEDNT